MIEAIVFRCCTESAGGSLCFLYIICTFLIAEPFGCINQLSGFDGFQLNTEYAHQLTVQCTAETKALRCVPDCGHTKGTHSLFNFGCPDDTAYDRLRFFLIRRAENIGERAVVKSKKCVGGRVCPCQRVETEAAAVNNGLAQRPQQERAGETTENFRHIGSIGKGQILEDNQIRMNAVQISTKIIDTQQHLLRTHKTTVNLFQKAAGA